MRHEEYMKQASKQSDVLQDIIGTADRISDKIDMVNSPSHYNQSGIECITAIQAALGPNFKYYLQGNIMKYLWRFDYKGKPLEDLDKAQWYLNALREDVAASDES
tara:strand:- start:450 stop:764 length:315 start_codon:yes stop_codon:yes gene_type:complete